MWCGGVCRGGLSASRHPSLVVQHALAAVRTGAELNISAYLADYADFGVRWENEAWDPAQLPAHPVGDPLAISKALQAKYAEAGTGWARCPEAPPAPM